MPLDLSGELDKIIRVNDEFQLGSDYSFPYHAETAYRSKQGNLYPFVTFLDRKPILDYLTGKISSSDSIEFILPPQNDAIHHPKISTAFDSASNSNHISNDKGDYAALDSRVFNQIETPVDYMSLICSSERSLKDRGGLLECKGRNFYAVLTSATNREEERQRIESQQRKDGLVAKSRLMGFDERGLTGFGDESGYDPNTKPKLHL